MGQIKVVAIEELEDSSGDANYTFELDDETVAYLNATYPNLELKEQLMLFIKETKIREKIESNNDLDS